MKPTRPFALTAGLALAFLAQGRAETTFTKVTSAPIATDLGVEVATLYGHFDYARSAKFTKDGNNVYSGGFGAAGHDIRVWNAPPLERMETRARSEDQIKQ